MRYIFIKSIELKAQSGIFKMLVLSDLNPADCIWLQLWITREQMKKLEPPYILHFDFLNDLHDHSVFSIVFD